MKLQRLFQVRLSSFFWLMLVIAAGIGGYRAGQEEQLARQRAGTMYAKAYSVNDLVLGPGMTTPDFDSLIDQLVLLSPPKWSQNGGAGSLSGFENAGKLVIYQDETTHRQVARKLAAMRRHIRWHWLDKQDYLGKTIGYFQGDDR